MEDRDYLAYLYFLEAGFCDSLREQVLREIRIVEQRLGMGA